MKKIVLEKSVVLEIAKDLKEGELSYDFLSTKYGIGKDQITMINTGKRYTEFLEGEEYPLRKKVVSRGKKNMVKSKLTDMDLVEIISLLQEGKVKYDDIAEKYGVNRQSIVQINAGKFESSVKEKYTFPIRTKHIRQEKGVKSFKLSEDDLHNISRLLKSNDLTFKQIGEMYGE